MLTFISFLAKSSLYRELFAIFAAKINDYEDIKVQIAERFCKETSCAADPLMRWAEFVEKTEWKSHAELKQAFPSADYVGNDRYVFNISGNKFRLVTIVVFFQGFLHIRFVGTHAEYDKIKDIKNI